MSTSSTDHLREIGRSRRAHGVRGDLSVDLLTDRTERLAKGARVQLRGNWYTVASARRAGQHWLVHFEGVDDRTAAESLIKAILWIDDSDDHRPAEEDAWYDHQLIGLTVRRSGHIVGTIARVDHLPAQDLLIVESNGNEVMVPFVKAIVTAVDIAAGTMDIDPPVGLFEEPVDDHPTDSER